MRTVFLLLAAFLFSAVVLAQPVEEKMEKLHVAIDSAMDESDYGYALERVNEALALKPADSIANAQKISILFALHRIDDFLLQVKQVYPVKDSAAQVMAIYSLRRDSREKTDSALVWQERTKIADAALVLNSKDSYANLSKAILEAEANNKNSSFLYMDQALAFIDTARYAQFRLIKAGIYADFNEKEAAINELKELIRMKPLFEEGYEQLINTYRHFNMFSEALTLLEEHSTKFDMTTEDLGTKYYILRDMGNKEAACSVVKELGDDNSYIQDDAAQKFGCPFLLAPLSKDANSEYDYEVYSDNKSYKFTVEKNGNTYTSGDIQFNWSMSDQFEEISKGTVAMSKAALDTAHTMLNKFSNEEDYVLTDKTTVWISRAVFDEITKNGQTNLNVDGTWRRFKFVPDAENESYYNAEITYNDEGYKRLPYLHIISDDDDQYEIWINNDRDYPLIIRMAIDFEVTLDVVSE